jgi:hypothetical protein
MVNRIFMSSPFSYSAGHRATKPRALPVRYYSDASAGTARTQGSMPPIWLRVLQNVLFLNKQRRTLCGDTYGAPRQRRQRFSADISLS